MNSRCCAQVLILIFVFVHLNGCAMELAIDSISVALMKNAPGWVKVDKFTNKEYPPADVVRVFLRKEEVSRNYVELAQLEVIQNVGVTSIGPQLIHTEGIEFDAVSDERAYILVLKSFVRYAKQMGADGLILLERKGFSVVKATSGIGNTKYGELTNLESSKTNKIYLKVLAVKF